MVQTCNTAWDAITNKEQFIRWTSLGITDDYMIHVCNQTGQTIKDLTQVISRHGEDAEDASKFTKAFAISERGSMYDKITYERARGRVTQHMYDITTPSPYQSLETSRMMYYIIVDKFPELRNVIQPLYQFNKADLLKHPESVRKSMVEGERDSSHLQCLGEFSGFAEVYIRTEAGEIYCPLEFLFSKDFDKIKERNISYWTGYNKKPIEKILATFDTDIGKRLQYFCNN